MNTKTNKITAIILVITLFMAFFIKFPAAYGAENKEYILGDANGDGYVKMTDVVMMQKYIAKLIDFSELQKKASDVTFDKQVTMEDVVAVQKYIAHLIEDFGEDIIIIDDTDTNNSDTDSSESDTSSDVLTDSEVLTDTGDNTDTGNSDTDTAETDTSSSDTSDANSVIIDGHTFTYGDEFTLNFYIGNIDVSVAAASLSVVFDSSCLSARSAELLPDITEKSDITTETNITEGAVFLALASPVTGLDLSESTKIFSVTFTVITHESTQTSVDINTHELFDKDFGDIISDNEIISGSPILSRDITVK